MNEIIFEKKGLSLERLHLLCKVAASGGIRMAVGDDPVRQSLASRQLKELREYVGAQLFYRNGRSIEMTSAGRELAELGNEFFAKMEAFLQRSHNIPVDFKLGVGDSIFQWQILPRMREFEIELKNIKLISFSYSAADIIKGVEARRLDAGIIRQTALSDSELISKPIGEIRYKLFVPNQLCTTAKRNQPPQIANTPFCTLTGDGEYAKAVTRLLSAFNGSPALNCSSMTQMFAAVQSGQYAAILPASAEASLPEPTTRIFTLPELSSFTRQISLIFKSDLNDSAEKTAVLGFLSNCID